LFLEEKVKMDTEGHRKRSRRRPPVEKKAEMDKELEEITSVKQRRKWFTFVNQKLGRTSVRRK
jgi:hypothetical protein